MTTHNEEYYQRQKEIIDEELEEMIEEKLDG